MGQYQRNVGNYQLALEALNKTYANSKQELAAMKTAMDNLDPSTKEYAQAFERASQITHSLSERQELLKYSSKDLGDQLANIRGIASNMAAGFSAAQAALGLFGGETEEVQKAMLKVQQAMALVQGLQGLDGLIKRTQGLSTALGISRAATNAQTVALGAETTATAAQTTATEGATVAQQGLNLAMDANPIGVVILAIEALVAIWVLFKDKIIEALGGQERLNTIFNNTIPVLKGVGNAILQFVIRPIKYFITTMKGVASIVQDVINGDFKKAWQDAGQTILNLKDDVKSSWDFAGNYADAKSKSMVGIAEKEEKKRKEAYDRDKDNYIKDQEAKYGADWKYTAEGRKAYEELYKNKMSLYKEDSEEYRQAQRDMWAYSRDYEARKKANAAAASKKSKEENEKAVAEAEAAAKKIHDAFQKNVIDFILTDSSKAFQSSSIRIKSMIDELVEDAGDSFVKLKDKAEEIMLTGSSNANIFSRLFNLLKNNVEQFAKNGLGREVNSLIKMIEHEVAKPFVDGVLDSLTEIETKTKATADQMREAFTNKEFTEGIQYPLDAIMAASNELSVYLDANDVMVKEVEKAQEKLRELGLENTKEYEYLEVKKTELANDASRARMEYAIKEAEAVKKSYEDQLAYVERFYGDKARIQENDIKKNTTGMDLFAGITPKKERERMEELFSIQMEGLQERKSILEQYAADTSISNEMRIAAEQQLADTIADIEDAEAEHTLQMTQQRIDAWKFYVDVASDSVKEMGNLFGSLADYYEADIDAKVKAGKITEEQADAQYENVKKMRLAEVVINTIAGAIGAFLQASATYPPPYGQIIGGISAAAVAAAGAAEYVKIKSSTRNGSSGVGGGGGTTYATVTPSITDYAPQGVTNVTGGQETENLKNALMGANISVSVTDINEVQNKVRVRDEESSF